MSGETDDSEDVDEPGPGTPTSPGNPMILTSPAVPASPTSPTSFGKGFGNGNGLTNWFKRGMGILTGNGKADGKAELVSPRSLSPAPLSPGSGRTSFGFGRRLFSPNSGDLSSPQANDDSPPAPTSPISERANTSTRQTARTKGTRNHQEDFDNRLSSEERRVLAHIRARRMMRTEDTINIDSFGADVIEGLVPRLRRGSLGLKRVGEI